MRIDAVLGFLGAAGLAGRSSAQQYGTSSAGISASAGNPNGGSGQPTCPFSHPTTVFVTVTTFPQSTLMSTVFSTVTAGTSTASGSYGHGGSASGSFVTSYLSSGIGLSSAPAGPSVTSSIIWSTDYLTLTLPPGPGQASSSTVTYTIVSPEGYSPSSANSESHLQTITITQGGGPASVETSTPFVIATLTDSNGHPYLSTIPSPSSPLIVTATIPAGGPGNGGLNTGNTTPVTVTFTLPSSLSTGSNAGVSESTPLQTITVILPSGSNGSGPQTLTITAPNESPTDANGGVQTLTVTIPSGEAGGQPETLTITGPSAPQTSSIPIGGTGESQPIQTLTVTIPNGEVGGQPQTLTITAPNGPPTNTYGDTGGNQPIQTFTVTIPSDGNGGPPETLTYTAPNQSPTYPNGGTGGNQPIQTLTITLPSGEAGSPPQTLTITASNGLPTSYYGGPGGNQPIQTFTVTEQNGSPTGSEGGVVSSQPVQTLTVTALNGLSTFTLTVPEQSPTGYGTASSQGDTQGSGSQGSSGTQPIPTVTITAPIETSTGSGAESGEAQPIATITLTLPDESTTGAGSGTGVSQPLPTVTITIPSGTPSSPAVLPGSGESQPLQTFTFTLPAEGQNGPQTITVTATGGRPGSPPNSPWSPSQSTVGQSGSQSAGAWPWPGSVVNPSTSPNPWPESGNPGGPFISASPCNEGGISASGVPWPSYTGGPPFPAVTLSSSEPFGLPPMSASPGSTAQANPNDGCGTSTMSETTIFPPEESSITAANPNPPPCTTIEPLSSGAQTGGESATPSPVPNGPSRGPFSSVPSSGWNFTTSAAQAGPVSESTSSLASPIPGETTCTESITQPGVPVQDTLTPSFPPPVSPAVTSPNEGPTVISPAGSAGAPAGGSGPDLGNPANCLSMTTMVISTMTFSWCADMPSSTPVGVSPMGQASIQNRGSVTLDPLAPPSNAQEYEWNPEQIDQRSPVTIGFLPSSISHAPSTLTTVVIPSRSRENIFASSETPWCGDTGDLGNFTLNFDDFPPADEDQPKPTPLYNPYHRFYYADGFSVVSYPPGPFRPSSGNLMVQFTPSSISNDSENGAPPDTGNISVGPQELATCFSFNFTGVSLGCDSKDAPCDFTFTGFKYDWVLGNSEVLSQTISVPVCQDTGNCSLTPITVSNFDDLTSITVKAEVNGKPTIWWADDFTLGWFDNSCDSGSCRSELPDGIQKRGWSATGRRAASKLMSLIGARG